LDRALAPLPRWSPDLNPPAFPSRLHGPLGRLAMAAVEVVGPQAVRERLRQAGAGRLPDDQVDELGAEIDLLAELLASGR